MNMPFTLLLLFASLPSALAQQTIEQWGFFELTLQGPTNGNPFVDIRFSAIFAWDHADSAASEASGFYDGEGKYRVRFMPPQQGKWHYTTHSSSPALDGKKGEFTATKP